MQAKWLIAGLLFSSASFGATLTISPAVAFGCSAGAATVTLTWSGVTGLVQINVGTSTGPALTGLLPESGSTTTGNWVADGLAFFLVDHSGATRVTEASAVAHVNCGGTPKTTGTVLSGGSYFPLAVGNTWVYQYSDRTITNSYLVNTITGTQVVGGVTYYVLTPGPMLLRGDDSGVIWRYTSTGDQVYLDSGAPGVQKTGYAGPLGNFGDAIMPPAQIAGGLTRTTMTFVRGVGLVNSQSSLMTGSSGGFTSGYDLVDVQVDGVRMSVPAPSLSLSVASTDLDVTNQAAPNCAIPCYFVACGIAGADPAGTYRPCAQARVDSTGAPAGSVVMVQLTSPSGTSVFSVQAAGGLDYVRLPLYTSNVSAGTFQVLAAGDYRLQATVTSAGSTVGSSSIILRIR